MAVTAFLALNQWVSMIVSMALNQWVSMIVSINITRRIVGTRNQYNCAHKEKNGI